MQLFRTLSFALLAVAPLFSACGNEETLTSHKAAQAIQRATWATAMLQQARHVVEPWNSLPIDFDEDQLHAHLADVYGACAHAERLSDPEGEPAVWHVSIDADCADHVETCSGELQLQTETNDAGENDANAPDGASRWLRIHNLALQCKSLLVNQGDFRLRKQSDPGQETPRIHVNASGLTYHSADENTLAAENFHTRFSFYDETVHTSDNTPLSAVIANGEATFEDIGAHRTWAADFEDLALYKSTATPRGGLLRLRTVDDSTYDFRTEWLPRDECSTQVTVRSGKERWIGRIGHDKDHPACKD